MTLTREQSRGRTAVPPVLASVAGWTWRILLLVLAGWVVWRAVNQLLVVLLPLAIALLGAALLQPVNLGLRRLGLARGLAALLTLLMVVAIVVGIGGVVVYLAVERADVLVAQISDSLDHLRHSLLHGSFPLSQDMLNQAQHHLVSAMQSRSGNFVDRFMTGVGVLFEAIGGTLLGLFTLFFLLYDGEAVWRWFLTLFPAAARPRLQLAGERAWQTLAGYTRGTLVIALVHGVVIGTVLEILGVPLVVPLALLVFLGSFIPVVGAFLAGGIAVLVTLATQGGVPAVILLVVLLAENEAEAHLLQPFLVGRFVHLHPLAIVVVIAFGSLLGGVWGVLLGTPLVGSIHNAWPALRGTPRDQLPPLGRDPRKPPWWRRIGSGWRRERRTRES